MCATCPTDQEKHVLSVIQSITVFQSTPILSAAVPWGLDHEETVFQSYAGDIHSLHRGASIQLFGKPHICRVPLATAEVRCFVYRFGDPYESRRTNKILLSEFLAALERPAQAEKPALRHLKRITTQGESQKLGTHVLTIFPLRSNKKL